MTSENNWAKPPNFSYSVNITQIHHLRPTEVKGLSKKSHITQVCQGNLSALHHTQIFFSLSKFFLFSPVGNIYDQQLNCKELPETPSSILLSLSVSIQRLDSKTGCEESLSTSNAHHQLCPVFKAPSFRGPEQGLW